MKYLAISFLVILSSTNLFAQQDCDGCQDYSILPRMPNFHITVHKEYEFDSEKFYVDGEQTYIEGKKIKIEYTHNNQDDDNQVFPSRLQVLRNYSQAIVKAGGNVIFERSNAEHGNYLFEDDEGTEVWVKLKTLVSGKKYYLIVIEREAMNQDVVIDASLIKSQIDIYGKVAIYGIHFDVGKHNIKPESKSTLEQIAIYLRDNSNVKLWVVGHTDSDGSFELNSELSLNRSRAIKTELESNYGITSGRLFAEGVGPLAPIASNKTEAGKKKNRRVEFVLK